MQNKQLSTSLLVVLGIGSMMGVSVFNIPSELAREANAGVIILSWIINIIGVLALVGVFKILSNKKKCNDGGLYAYAKTYTGDFGSAMVAYGYYACTIFSVAYFFQSGISSLTMLLPQVGNMERVGLNLTQLVLTSIALWYMSITMFKGILGVSNISLVASAFKVLPLLLIIIASFVSFDINHFIANDVSELRSIELGSVHAQLRNTTNSILWLFVGFEGLSVLSGRAYKTKNVGTAILWSFIITATLYFLVTISCIGAVPINELTELPFASTGFILEKLVGKWGQLFIEFSIIVSIFGAIIIWCMYGVEILYLSSKDKQFIDVLGVEHNGVPRNAVLFTVVLIQVLLICGYVFNIDFRSFDNIMSTTLLVPYIITTLYGLRYVLKEEHYSNETKKFLDLIIVIVAMVYAIWALHTTGFDLLVICVSVYAIGVIQYIINKALRKEKIFTKGSAFVSALIITAAVSSLILYFN